MKLLYDHQIFTHQKYGGISRYFYELISNIHKRSNVDISLFMGYFINEFGLERLNESYLSYFGKKHRDSPKSKLLYLYLNNFLFKKFTKNINSDIYHQTYYQYLNKDSKVKRIITVYDMTHELYPNLFSSLDKTPEWKKASIPNADGIICISEFNKKRLIQDSLKSLQKKLRLYILVFLVQKSMRRKGRLIRLIYCLWVIELDIKILICFLNVLLQIITLKGILSWYVLEDMILQKKKIEVIRKFRIEGRVEYLKGSDKLLANLYHNATAFVYPSKYEGFGYSTVRSNELWVSCCGE